jgi:hypothetical protein
VSDKDVNFKIHPAGSYRGAYGDLDVVILQLAWGVTEYWCAAWTESVKGTEFGHASFDTKRIKALSWKCIRMPCFTDQEYQYSFCQTLGTELQYTSLHEQYYTTVTYVAGN